MSNLLIDLQDRKGKPCVNCGIIHIIQNRCRYEDLVKRIGLLLEANQMIPAILAANKEAVQISENFQGLLNKADEAHSILMKVLKSHGETGETILNEYLKELDEWANQTISQDTEQLTLGTESSTSNETSDKNSTEEMTSGENSQTDSSLLITNATDAEISLR